MTCEELAATQYGLVSWAQAKALGLSNQAIARRVAAGRWVRLAPRVYRVAGTPEHWCQRLMLALLWAGDGAAVSHRAAAALLGLDGFKQDVVEVSVPANKFEPPAGVVCHRVKELGPAHVTTVRGIRVTTCDRLLMDLVSTKLKLDEARLEKILDDVLRRGLASLSRIAWTAEHSCCRGRLTVLRLVDRRRARNVHSESELEALFLRRLQEWGLPMPRPQRRVTGRVQGQAFEGRVDYDWEDRPVAVELDSRAWHSTLGAWQRDRTKRNLLTAQGRSVLQITWEDLTDHAGQTRDLLAPLLARPQPDARPAGVAGG